MLLERGAIKSGIAEIERELRAYEWADADLVQDCVMALAIAAAHAPPVDATGDVDLAAIFADPRNRQELSLGGMVW